MLLLSNMTIVFHAQMPFNISQFEQICGFQSISLKAKILPDGGFENIKVSITPKTFFRFVKSLHGIRKNAAKIFAIS